MTSEHLDKIEQEAWQSWEDDQKTNPKRVNPHAYTYGYKAGRLKSDEEKDTRIKELEEGMQKAIDVIKQWHNCDEVWDIYINKAPEMQFIKQLLTKK